MAKRKQQLESFDVSEFLRSSDEDMKSALTSILRDAVPSESRAEKNADILRPGINLIPGSELPSSNAVQHNLTAEAKELATLAPLLEAIANQRPNPEVEQLILGPNPDPILRTLTEQISEAYNETSTLPEPISLNIKVASNTTDKMTPGTKLGPGIKLTNPNQPLPNESLVDGEPDKNKQLSAPAAKKRNFPIREMKLAQDAHTRAEQQVYQSLWENAKVHDGESRIITIGFGTMAKLARLSESNARLNLRSLITKLAIEEYRGYNCELSVGRTYRVFNYSEILRQRREAGLTHYMRRTLAVVFVNKETGEQINLNSKNIRDDNSVPGIKLVPPPGIKLTPESGPNLTPAPPSNLVPPSPPNLGPPYREEYREKTFRESSSKSIIIEALKSYGTPDDDAITKMWNACRKVCPDCTEEEVVHFINEKGALVHKENSRISNPLGFLLISVPKCFVGKSFDNFRQKESMRQEEETVRRSNPEGTTELMQTVIELINLHGYTLAQAEAQFGSGLNNEDWIRIREALHP